MARYIDADKVMEEIARIGGHNLCEWETIGVKAMIDRMPTADVAPKSEVALEVIKEVERILNVNIINIEEDFFHGTASRWDAIKRGCYEEVLVDLAELKKKYTEETV